MNESKNILLPALIAVGSGLAATDADAIELGEIDVQSKLGQPLRASIAYALAPNEHLAEYCVSLKQGFANNGLPAITRANISVSKGVISLTGHTAVREPLMTVRLDLACPYTPKLTREYMLLIDPAEPVAEPVASVQTTSQSAAVTVTPATAAPTVRPQTVASAQTSRATVTRVSTPRTAIDGNQQYRVQPGDSLSMIAQRIDNRSVGLWDAVAQIFAANPNAFIDNDPNKLKAGSLLVIPNFGSGSRLAAAANVFEPVAVSEAATNTQVANAVDYPELTTVQDDGLVDPTVGDDTNALEAPLEFGSLVSGADSGDITETPSEPVIAIPDTEIEVPESTATSPNVPTATLVDATEPVSETTTNWLLWFIGGGITLIAGLLIFGRRNRSPIDSEPVVAAAASFPMRRATDDSGNTIEVEEITEPELQELESTYNIEDDSPTQDNLALDANLEIGTGLSEGTDMHVAEDFGYAMNNELDLELPEEAGNADSSDTDINTAIENEDTSVLENEVMQDDDDYDMSVIVDATKMPRPDDATERDLKAVVVNEINDTMIKDEYTLSREIDYHILEQDYEDELTATQALNLEIERAAAELADNIDDDTSAEDKIVEMPLATVTELDVTTNMSADDETEISDLDDTGINEAITENLFAEEKTVEMAADEKTVEMTIESGKVDTKAG